MKAGSLFCLSYLLLALSAAHAQEFGAFTSFQPNEITPGMYVRFSAERISYQWSMTVPVVLHDRYNGERSNVSYWSPAMVALGAVEYLAGVDLSSDSLSGFLGNLFLLALPVISNGQLNVNLVPKSSLDAVGVQASAFIGWDTALFGMRDIKWFRLTPKAGFAFYKLMGSPGDETRLSLGLDVGVKQNLDSPEGRRNPPVGFIAVEVGLN